MPWISIVVPVFNHAAHIGECLGALQGQSFGDWECIVVDDGSTDGLFDVIRTRLEDDPRFRYLRQDNAGAAAARNTGLRHATGEWIGFLDADDYYFDGALVTFRRAAEQLRDACPGIIAAHHRIEAGGPAAVPEGGRQPIVRDAFFTSLNFRRDTEDLTLQSTIFRRSLLERIGGAFHAGYRTSEDREFLIRCAASSAAAFVDVEVARYRRDHGGGKSDRYNDTGEKVVVHQEIVRSLPELPVIEDRLRRSAVDEADFRRLRAAYLDVLAGVAAARRESFVEAAERLGSAADRWVDRRESLAMMNMAIYFLLVPSTHMPLALRECGRRLMAIASAAPPRSRLVDVLQPYVRDYAPYSPVTSS